MSSSLVAQSTIDDSKFRAEFEQDMLEIKRIRENIRETQAKIIVSSERNRVKLEQLKVQIAQLQAS